MPRGGLPGTDQLRKGRLATRNMASRPFVGLAAAAVVLTTGLAAGGFRSGASPAPQALTHRRVAVIGIDAGDWQVIDRLVSAGRLPTFAALEQRAVLGIMRPEPPLLSPIIWTTIATGRRPEDHGVLDFMVDLPGGGQAPVSGGARRAKALWEILSDANRPVLVAGWWATWPADHVRGVMVSDRVATPHVGAMQGDAGLVYPPGRLPDVEAARLRPDAIDYAALNRFVPLTLQEFHDAEAESGSPGRLYRNRFAHVRAALAAARTYRAVMKRLLPAVGPELAAVYYELVDTAGHLFANDSRRREIAMASAYHEMDDAIAETARAVDPDTLLLVISDHGFFSPDAGIPEDPSDLTSGAAAWHRPYGILAAVTAGALSGTHPATPASRIGDISPLDIVPTILAVAGLPAARDMPGQVIAVASLAGGKTIDRIASYGSHRLPEKSTGDESTSPDGDRAAGGRAGASAAASEELERLRALGYVSGAQAVTSLARVNLGEILFRKGDAPGAIRELRAVVRADPLNQRAALWLARALAAAGRTDEAIREYDRLVQLAAVGSRVDAIVVLAATDLDLQQGRPQEAAERLARVPVSLARAPETLIARGALAEADARFSEAQRSYESALTAQPASIDALRRAVDLLLKRNQVTRANQLASEAVRRFGDSPERHALAGEVALAERRYEAAARRFNAALALAPDAESVRIELARCELLQHHADRALSALDAIDSRDAHTLRGAAYSSGGRWVDAASSYQHALAKGEPTADLLNALGHALLESGRPADAVPALERSLSIRSDQPEIRALLERARQAGGRKPGP